MREIKFRCWDKEEKQMYDVIGMSRYYLDKSMQPSWIGKLHKEMTPTCQRGVSEEEESNFILMQYTGLRDNTKWEDLTEEEQEIWLALGRTKEEWNGREIYEGDIVEQQSEWDRITVRGEVVFSRGMFVVRDCDHREYLLNETAEVIGNIYENPALLKKEKKMKTDEVIKLLRKMKKIADEAIWACNDADDICEEISEFISEKLEELQQKRNNS